MVDIRKGDRLPVLTVTIKKTDGTALDLTGATAKFVMVDAQGTVVIDSDATVKSPATSGVVEYAWASGDTDVAGDYRGEIEVTIGGKMITAPSIEYIPIKIHEDLG